MLITGPTGMGKTWIACALGNKACRDGFTVQYRRLSRLFYELGYAHGDGRYPKVMKNWPEPTSSSWTALSEKIGWSWKGTSRSL